MSEYKNIILKINKFIPSKTLITDVGSSKTETSKIINKFLKKGIHWTQSHPIAGSEVSGPEHGKENMFTDRWCIICLLYTSPSPRDIPLSRMPSSA